MDHDTVYLLHHTVTKNYWLLWWANPEECSHPIPVEPGWVHCTFPKEDWILSLGNDDQFKEDFMRYPWTITPNYTALPVGICAECEGPTSYYDVHYLCGDCRDK